METSTVQLADITTLIEGIKAGLSFIWSLFGDLVNTIASNPLLAWSVGLAIVCGSIGIALAVVKAFGLKGRRR